MTASTGYTITDVLTDREVGVTDDGVYMLAPDQTCPAFRPVADDASLTKPGPGVMFNAKSMDQRIQFAREALRLEMVARQVLLSALQSGHVPLRGSEAGVLVLESEAFVAFRRQYADASPDELNFYQERAFAQAWESLNGT